MIKFILLVLILAFSYAYFRRPKLNLPGPRGLPIVGYAPFVSQAPHLTYMKLAKIYGPIFKVQLGTTEWLILNSKEAIHEAFVRNKKATSGRPRNVIMDALAGDKSITFTTDLHFWKEQKTFLSKGLKSFGYEKMEHKIRDELTFLLPELAAHNGQPCDCQGTIIKAVCNVSCQMIIGKRYDYHGKAYKEILPAASVFASGNKKAKYMAKMMNSASFFRFLPVYREVFAEHVSYYIQARAELASHIEEHKNTLDKEKPRDLLDLFLVEISKRTGQNDKVFTESHLPTAIHPVIGAASDTTTNTVRWCIVGLASNQKYQARMYEEVTAVLESKSYISMGDHFKMPFTRAYLQEVMRFCVPIPLLLPHCSTEDFTLSGYKIPKGTPMFANVWSVHRSEKLFDIPDEFRPERFLDAEGNFVYCEDLLTFSIGPRRCIGEQLGRLEVFLFVTYMVSKFLLLPDEEGPKVELGKGMSMIGFAPEKFKARFVERGKSGAA